MKRKYILSFYCENNVIYCTIYFSAGTTIEAFPPARSNSRAHYLPSALSNVWVKLVWPFLQPLNRKKRVHAPRALARLDPMYGPEPRVQRLNFRNDPSPHRGPLLTMQIDGAGCVVATI